MSKEKHKAESDELERLLRESGEARKIAAASRAIADQKAEEASNYA